MSILCFEGPSAVGKSATASEFAAAVGAYVIAEVNALWKRPEDEPSEWYLERQVDRYALAVKQVRRHPLVVLNGDPFQPLWYNWAYDFVGWLGLDFLEAFYRPRLLSGDIGFPDLYVVFTADVEMLRQRKEADRTRQRRGFETHLRFIEPQRRYFEAMQRFSPERVRFLDSQGIGENVQAVAAAAREACPEQRPAELFDQLVGWLRGNSAS
jgi:hypothetical protein